MKVAVILIHGIGEQVPMDTLRGFVKAVWTTDASVGRPGGRNRIWSKPDTMSGDFELRRLTTSANRERKLTDFYEYYWAHMMEGTQVSHLLAWLKLLLFRSPGIVPRQLRGLWYFLVISAIATALGISAFYIWGDEVPSWLKLILSVAGPMLWATVGAYVVKKVVGDAARYLHVAPGNIESRRRIREGGVKLLERLHCSGEYDRIIVVGHSLGTVIGYDILTVFWAKNHAALASDRGGQSVTALSALEDLARNQPAKHSDYAAYAQRYQAAQSDYFLELKLSGHPWLVTDFVTMGSPLAHGVLLMARTGEEFEQKKDQREFPTCPPVLESITVAPKRRQLKFSFLLGQTWCPHQAATFAPTRWTNLYFPCRSVVWGDVVGGAVAPAFGPGVLDVPVTTTLQRGLFTHTLYWALPKSDTATPSWIQSLRDALRLCLTPPRPLSATESPPVTSADRDDGPDSSELAEKTP